VRRRQTQGNARPHRGLTRRFRAWILDIFDFTLRKLSMRQQTLLLLALSLSLGMTPALAADNPGLKTQEQRLGYSLGYQQGSQLRQQDVTLDNDAFLRGLKDSLAGKPSLMSNEEVRETLNTLRDAQNQKRIELSQKNRTEGEKFLAENKKKPDIKTLPSGLQYKIIKPGTGKSPTLQDTVVAHYRGTLLDGREFDSSYARNEPTTFPLGNVIKGWQEALPLIKEGGKMQIFVPSNLAYGGRSPGGIIGPNATLVFDIELIEVKSSK